MPRGSNTLGLNYMPRHVQGVGLVGLGDYESKKAHLLLTSRLTKTRHNSVVFLYAVFELLYYLCSLDQQPKFFQEVKILI